jgi:hypothetical protein
LFQFSGRISVRPTVTKNKMMAIFRITMALFEVADSLIPSTRMTVMHATTRKAGRLAMKGKPKGWGAVATADAR